MSNAEEIVRIIDEGALGTYWIDEQNKIWLDPRYDLTYSANTNIKPMPKKVE